MEGRQLTHMQEIYQADKGTTLKIGMLNGEIGHGTISEITAKFAVIDFKLDSPPPAKLPLTLLLALPRPKMLKRILQTVATLGVAELYLMNSNRVEKSFWQTPLLKIEAIREQLMLGLEQGVDTVLPTVHLRKRFKPFVEDELPKIANGKTCLVAHPIGNTPCPLRLSEASVLAIGPEGGFIPYEIAMLNKAGFETVTLGPRILRVETAVTSLTTRLYP